MLRFIKRFYLAILLVFMYLPIGALIISSFNESKNMAAWTGFSTRWYEQLFHDPAIAEVLWVTISIALLSALIASVIGTLAVIGMDSLRKKPKNAVLNLTYIPMVNADIVTGISLLLLFIFLNIPRGYWTMLLAHITFNIPYVIFSVLPKMRQMDRSTYEAALDMGARPAYAVRKVVLPQIMPGIVTGFILAFTMSFDDFMISFFTTQGVTQNLSTYIYSMARVGLNPMINALSAIMFAVVITLLIAVNVRSLKKSKKTLQREY
ncbi:MAG TPA: spermidine/putrescine ABC transporter permease [Clostridiales bacterium]|nr:spermidine/putrescine ABC transporter permease [Clostridiales bacterium]